MELAYTYIYIYIYLPLFCFSLFDNVTEFRNKPEKKKRKCLTTPGITNFAKNTRRFMRTESDTLGAG